MPTGKLSGEGKTLWEKVYNDSKAKGDSEEIAAKKAWSAVKSADAIIDSRDDQQDKQSDERTTELHIIFSFYSIYLAFQH